MTGDDEAGFSWEKKSKNQGRRTTLGEKRTAKDNNREHGARDIMGTQEPGPREIVLLLFHAVSLLVPKGGGELSRETKRLPPFQKKHRCSALKRGTGIFLSSFHCFMPFFCPPLVSSFPISFHFGSFFLFYLHCLFFFHASYGPNTTKGEKQKGTTENAKRIRY